MLQKKHTSISFWLVRGALQRQENSYGIFYHTLYHNLQTSSYHHRHHKFPDLMKDRRSKKLCWYRLVGSKCLAFSVEHFARSRSRLLIELPRPSWFEFRDNPVGLNISSEYLEVLESARGRSQADL